MHLGNDSLGQTHIRATTGKHQAGTNQNHGWAGSGLARITTMADQDRGWPGSGLVLIMADQDYGWSGLRLGRIATGSWLARSLAGRDHGWSGSWPAKIKTKLGPRLDPSCPNKNASGTCLSRIRPGPDPVRRAIGLDQLHHGQIGHAGLNSGLHRFFSFF